MKESFHDSIQQIMRNLEYFDFYETLEPDEIFYSSRDTYNNNAHQIECQSIVFQKLSPTMVPPKVLYGRQHSVFDFCLLHNFSLWVDFIQQHVNFLFPVIFDNLHANRNSFMLTTLIEECKSQLDRIKEMKKFYVFDDEQFFELYNLETEFSDFFKQMKILEEKHRMSFLSIFYKGKNTKCINSQDILREIYSFL